MRTIVALVIVLSLAGNVSADMVAHWTFDEDAGLTNHDSAGDNDGTIYGATWTDDGKVGGALSFNGTDSYVDVPDDPSLRFDQSDSFSIAYWAKPTTDGGCYLISKMRASGQGIFGYSGGYYAPNGEFGFVVEQSGWNYASVQTQTDAAPAGSWYHVAAVYDNGNMKIYLNGQLEGTGTFNYDTGTTTPDEYLCIGARAYDGKRDLYFKGLIDDVRIYNNALSQAEVVALVPEPASAMIMTLGATIISLRRRKC